MAASEPHQDRIEHAIKRLKSLHDGEAGFSEVVGLGAAAVPALLSLLFEREPSGLHQARCRAAEALAALKAFDALGDFLRDARTISDPVERLGEDAVLSTAARSIARLNENWVYRLLVELAHRRKLNGVLAGLGAFGRKASVPILVDALSEDDVRLTAEAVLRTFGAAARRDLVAAAVDQGHDERSESESHLRKRRSALGLLLELGIARRHWPVLRALIDDEDRHIALLACGAAVEFGAATDGPRAMERLRKLKIKADWLERSRVDDLIGILSARDTGRLKRTSTR